MQTKYDVGQCVLVRGVVKALRADESGLHYLVSFSEETDPFRYADLSFEEKELVCGWIGEKNE